MPDIETSRLLRNQIAFLRMAAIEMRNLANAALEIAPELRQIADKLEDDAAELLNKLGE